MPYVDGDTGFCIQPGVPLKIRDRLKESSSDIWNALSSAQKKAVGLALLHGYQGNRSKLLGSDDEKWLATQTLVWEFVTGCRQSTGSFKQTSTDVYKPHFGSNYVNSGAKVVRARLCDCLPSIAPFRALCQEVNQGLQRSFHTMTVCCLITPFPAQTVK